MALKSGKIRRGTYRSAGSQIMFRSMLDCTSQFRRQRNHGAHRAGLRQLVLPAAREFVQVRPAVVDAPIPESPKLALTASQIPAASGLSYAPPCGIGAKGIRREDVRKVRGAIVAAQVEPLVAGGRAAHAEHAPLPALTARPKSAPSCS